MATIIEDYVSFETAKLLEEKGFDEPTIGTYNKDGKLVFLFLTPNNWNSKFGTPICAPTLQMTMKWLRVVHKISIEITSKGYPIDDDIEWECDIKAGRRLYFKHITNEKSFESCAEAAIKYCLENLI